MYFYRYLGERIEASAAHGRRPRDREPRRARRSGCRHIDYDEVLRSKIIVGTPAMVVGSAGRSCRKSWA